MDSYYMYEFNVSIVKVAPKPIKKCLDLNWLT